VTRTAKGRCHSCRNISPFLSDLRGTFGVAEHCADSRIEIGVTDSTPRPLTFATRHWDDVLTSVTILEDAPERAAGIKRKLLERRSEHG
jgi:hypothetical protein